MGGRARAAAATGTGKGTGAASGPAGKKRQATATTKVKAKARANAQAKATPKPKPKAKAKPEARSEPAPPPDMALVLRWAKKHGVAGEVRPSERKEKKLKVRRGGRWIHFGHPGYEDFTTHRDRARQRSYCRRAGGIRDGRGALTGNDPESPNYYSMRLLWDCKPG